MILNFFRNRYKRLIIITVVIAIAVGVMVLLWPFEPKKPTIIPLGDYSYTIEYVDYKINKFMKK